MSLIYDKSSFSLTLNFGVIMAAIGLHPIAQQPAQVAQQPKFKFEPGFIYGSAYLESEKAQALGVAVLYKENWAKISESEREEIIASKRFIYIKINHQTKDVVEIGAHTLKCDEINKLGLTRVLLGIEILPPNVRVTALHEVVYQKTLTKFLPGLS